MSTEHGNVIGSVSVSAWRIDALQRFKIELGDGLKFIAEACDEQVFREVVEPLPVIGLQRQEDFHRVAPALWFRSAVLGSPVTDRWHLRRSR